MAAGDLRLNCFEEYADLPPFPDDNGIFAPLLAPVIIPEATPRPAGPDELLANNFISIF